jgi:hypothetical protein
VIERRTPSSSFFRAIESAERLGILKGLPHPFHEKLAFSQELDSKAVREIHGSVFYQESRPLELEHDEAIRSVLADPRTFVPFPRSGPIKLCGGFHSDFAVEFHHSGEVGAALICFGCGEIKTLIQGDRWHHDVRPQAMFVLKLVLRQASGDFPV